VTGDKTASFALASKPKPRLDQQDSPGNSARQQNLPSGNRSIARSNPRHTSGFSGFLSIKDCFWGRRPGCNPPSVLSSICLIGEPAPPAEDHRRLLPLSHRRRDPFHPQFPALHQRSPGEGVSSSSWTGQGLVSAPPHRLSPGTSYDHNGLRHVGGVSSRPPSMVL